MRCKKQEISMVKQPKITLYTFDGMRCQFNNYESVPRSRC